MSSRELTIKDHIKGSVTFVKYHNGNLYYQCETGLQFPVPVSDTGNAEFVASDKAMLFLRWIRKHLAATP
jgi:hypothetical protein